MKNLNFNMGFKQLKLALEKTLFLPLAIAMTLIASFNFLSSFVSAQEMGVVGSGVQVGGRILIDSVCTPPPVVNPLCAAARCTPAPAVSVVYVNPAGYSASQLCIATAGLLTSGPPITPASVGGQILGLFMIPLYPGPAVPVGTVGTSL